MNPGDSSHPERYDNFFFFFFFLLPNSWKLLGNICDQELVQNMSLGDSSLRTGQSGWLLSQVKMC